LHSAGGLQPFMDHEVRSLIRRAKTLGLHPRITSSFRSLTLQRWLYAQSLHGRNSYPIAPPGLSLHNYGLEVDIISDDNRALGRLWTDMGHRWGGRVDPIAFAF